MSADPRSVDNNNQGNLILAFPIEENAGVFSLTASDLGAPIALTTNNEISDGADQEAFFGKLEGVTDDGATGLVQVRGVCTGLPYSGTTPVIGWPIQMSGAGTVDKGVDAGLTRGFTVNVDTNTTTCDILL